MKRDELRAAIQTAQSFKVTLAKDERTAETLEAAKKEASIKLRAWYEDWSETARSVVKRRDYLIAWDSPSASRAQRREPHPWRRPAGRHGTAEAAEASPEEEVNRSENLGEERSCGRHS